MNMRLQKKSFLLNFGELRKDSLKHCYMAIRIPHYLSETLKNQENYRNEEIK